jgi:hypothetical protein
MMGVPLQFSWFHIGPLTLGFLSGRFLRISAYIKPGGTLIFRFGQTVTVIVFVKITIGVNLVDH